MSFQKLDFFDQRLVNDEKAVNFFNSVNEITCCTSGSGQIVFGDNDGNVHVMDQGLRIMQCKAFDKIVHHLVQRGNYLVCCGDDNTEAKNREDNYIVRIFDLSSVKVVKNPNQKENVEVDKNIAYVEFKCVKEVKLWSQSTKIKIPYVPITVIQASEDMMNLALGMGNGLIIAIQGDLVKGKGTIKQLPGLNNGARITWLEFTRYSGPKTFCLYCTTLDAVFRYIVSPRGFENFHIIVKREPMSTSESDKGSGAEYRCVSVNDKGELVLGTQDGIFSYNPHDRGTTKTGSHFEGKKLLLTCYKHYTIVVSTDFNMKRILTIYDVNNSLIACKLTSEVEQYKFVLQEWGSIFLVATTMLNGREQEKLVMLKEVDTQSKVEQLLSQNLYSNAVDLVSSVDPSFVQDIHKRHAEHLYKKQSFDKAIEKYIETIGYLEPSEVIQNFLDAQKIECLTDYLEALHEKEMATSDHTTLLLNCYTKLKGEKTDKLNKFIETQDKLRYDVETAIQVCRDAGYIEHALKLALKHAKDDWYIKLHIEDLEQGTDKRNYKRALRHIESLEFSLACDFMLQYGKILARKIPKRVANVLIRLCTHWFPISAGQRNRQLDSSLMVMKNRIETEQQKKHQRFRSEDKEYYEFFGLKFEKKSETKKDLDETDFVPSEEQIQRAKPDQFIQAFSSPFWLMVFLEHVILRTRHQSEPQSEVVYNTLVEFYLKNLDNEDQHQNLLIDHSLNQKDLKRDDNYDILPVDESFQQQSYRQKLISIFDDQRSNFDPEHCLVLVENYGFKEGVLKMYGRLGLHYDILQYYLETGNSEKIIETCKSYGGNDQNMWIQVLTFFSNSTIDYNDEIKATLEYIEKHNILPPLLIVQILSKSKNTKLGVIKPYLTEKLEKEKKIILNDLNAIKDFQSSTEEMRKEVLQLRTEPKIFQLTKCSACDQPLDLPAIHFMCEHSYHLKCLPEQEECFECAKQNHEILQRKKQFELSSGNHDAFFKSLEKSKSDGFSVVSEWLGRSLFDKINKSIPESD